MISIDRVRYKRYRVEAKTSTYRDYDSRHTLSHPAAKHGTPASQIIPFRDSHPNKLLHDKITD